MLAHLLYSFVSEEYPQVLLENLSKKNLRVPCLFRCLIFKVRCLSKEGRFVSYHTYAALSTPFLQPVHFFFRPPFRRFFAFARPPSFKSSELSLKSACLFYQTTSPLSTPFSPFFSPSLHPSARFPIKPPVEPVI